MQRPQWKPRGKRRRRRLTEPVHVLLSPQEKRSLTASAALFGMSQSALVRSAIMQTIRRAHDVQPAIDVPAEETA